MSDHIFMTEVAQPVLIKEGGLFLVCRADAEVTTACGSGLGLFHRDTRFLSRYELRIGGAACLSLMSSAARGWQSVHDLTNTAIRQRDGSPLELQSLGARLERSLDGHALTLTDRLTVRNYTRDRAAFELTVLMDALFEDLFELRGAKAKTRGPPREVARAGDGLVFRYHGADGVERTLSVGVSPRPRLIRRAGAWVAAFDVELATQASQTLAITFTVSETATPAAADAPDPPFYDGVRIVSDDGDLDRVMSRSFRDLAMLRTGLESNFLAGGMPWFVAPFGRDSLLAALQTLAFDPRPAEEVARLFAHHQGRRDDPATGEQPGKIAHELRLGEMARLKEVAHGPSYMSVDSTPLFLILVGRHAEWSGDLDLFEELRPNIEAALAWIDRQCRHHPAGYLAYSGRSAAGPINQGWKDSTLGVPRKNGGVPRPPIALCEVQGYVYLARTLVAKAFEAAGEPATARRLEDAAAAHKERFNRDFWMEDEGCYALALERGGRQVTVVTSNAGQVLWSGIAEPDKAARTARRLLAPDMDSGWGLRTLSTLERAYNPLNYHLGSVWPFDNALIVDGLRRYGLDDEAVALCDSVMAAAGCFALGRLPEFYVGLGREADLFPARCPFAEPLQAWSSGAAPYMLASLLGLRGGPAGIHFDRPILPSLVNRLTVSGLTLGARRFDCDVVRSASGAVTATSRIGKEDSDGRQDPRRSARGDNGGQLGDRRGHRPRLRRRRRRGRRQS